MVTKVFKIELSGARDVNKGISSIKKAMTATGKAISSTKAELDLLFNAKGDASEVEALTKKLGQLTTAYENLKKQKKAAQDEAKRERDINKELSAQKVREAKERQAAANAVKSEENARKAKIQADVAEERQARRTKAALDGLPGSYNKIKEAIKQLKPFVESGGLGGIVDFNGQQLNIEQAIGEFKRLTAAEQDWRRQFSRDGLLVSEYSSGIVQAFKQMNIDDIIRGQVTGARDEISKLEAKTLELVQAYRAAQTAGSADMMRLEKEIHDTVIETQQLKKAVADAEVQLKGIGGVGTQITSSINSGFKNLKSSIGQYVIGFFGIQAALSGGRTIFDDVVKLDSQGKSLEFVSKTTAELARNQQFLEKTSDDLGLELLDTTEAYKNFYTASTQAGISVSDTKDIFFAAANAGANLRLSTEQINGVLLAFSQVASKGKVQAEELRGQIGERIPGAFSIAARSIGKTETELNKMLENGEVIASDFLPKFARELQKTFGSERGAQIESIRSNISRLKNDFVEKLRDNQGGLTFTINAIISGLRLGIKLLPLFVSLLALYTTGWLLANKEMIIARGLFLFQRNILPVITLLLGGQANAMKLYAAATALASKGLGLLTRLMGSPIFRIFSAVLGVSLISLKAFSESTAASAEHLSQAALQQRFLSEALREANKETVQAISKENILLSIIRDRTLADRTRQKALDDLKNIMGEYGEKLTLENVLTKEGTEQIKKYNEQLQLSAKIRAAQAIAEREDQKLQALTVSQQDIERAIATKGTINTTQLSDDVLKAYYDATGRSASAIGKWLGDKVGIDFTYSGKDLKIFSSIVKKKIEDQTKAATAAAISAMQAQAPGTPPPVTPSNQPTSLDDLYKQLDQVKSEIKGIDLIKNKTDEQLSKLKALRKQRDEIIRQIKELGGKFSTGRDRGSRLSGQEKDAFKDIDAIRDRLLAEQRELYLTLQLDEKGYLKNVLKINTDANNEKLKVIKGADAEERKIIAELNLQKITDQQEANKKLFEIDNRDLEVRLSNQQRALSQLMERVENDPTLTNTQRLKAREDFFTQQLKDQIIFNQEQIALEKKYGIASIENEEKRKEAIEAINKEIREAQRGTPQAQIQDIRDAGDKQIAEFDIYYARLRKAILSNTKITEQERQRQLDELEKSQRRTIVSSELATLTIEFKKKEDLYQKGLISEKEYLAAKKAMEEKAAEAEEPILKQLDRFQNGIQGFIDGIGNLLKSGDLFQEEIGNSGISVGYVIAQGYNVAAQALQSYYDVKRQNIEQEKQDHIDQLDREKERVLARAKSAAEEDTINRQYEQKKREIEKQSGEKLKKQKIAEARIALVAEEANIAVQAAANPANAVTFGAAGALQFAILSAIALARYAFSVATINKQQFAESGRVRRVGPGKITGRPNIAEQSNGDNMLATVRVGEVVLNKRHQQMLGGDATFRRIGVPGFAGSGRVTAPQFGTYLKPPSFNNGYNSAVVNANSASNDRMDRLEAVLEEVLGAVYATDAKEVRLDPHKVTAAQIRRRKDVKIGKQ